MPESRTDGDINIAERTKETRVVIKTKTKAKKKTKAKSLDSGESRNDGGFPASRGFFNSPSSVGPDTGLTCKGKADTRVRPYKGVILLQENNVPENPSSITQNAVVAVQDQADRDVQPQQGA